MPHRCGAIDWRRSVIRCRNVAGSHEDAEAFVQEALVAALDSDLESISDLEGWVVTVARRRAIDAARRRSACRSALVRVAHRESREAEDVAERVAARDEAAWLASRLDELPATTVAVVRTLASGRSIGETADELGMSYRSVESHLTRARRWARCALAR